MKIGKHFSLLTRTVLLPALVVMVACGESFASGSENLLENGGFEEELSETNWRISILLKAGSARLPLARGRDGF